jgi:hypothetical protein
MGRMLFAAFAVICWASLPSKAEVLTLSCDGIMKEQEQEKPHTITKLGLIVDFDARVVTGVGVRSSCCPKASVHISGIANLTI